MCVRVIPLPSLTAGNRRHNLRCMNAHRTKQGCGSSAALCLCSIRAHLYWSQYGSPRGPPSAEGHPLQAKDGSKDGGKGCVRAIFVGLLWLGDIDAYLRPRGCWYGSGRRWLSRSRLGLLESMTGQPGVGCAAWRSDGRRIPRQMRCLQGNASIHPSTDKTCLCMPLHGCAMCDEYRCGGCRCGSPPHCKSVHHCWSGRERSAGRARGPTASSPGSCPGV